MDHLMNKSNVREDMHKKLEKRDVVDDINPEGKYDEEKKVEKQWYEKPEKKDGDSSSSITYYNRQSSTKTEAVNWYVEFPVLNHFRQLVTPLSNPGPEQPEKRDVMVNINLEAKHDKV
jgi:hypothetical protein